MRKWKLPGPDGIALTKADIVSVIKCGSEKTLDRMIEDGDFPPGDKNTEGTEPVWSGDVVAAWLRLRFWLLSENRKKKPRAEKSS